MVVLGPKDQYLSFWNLPSIFLRTTLEPWFFARLLAYSSASALVLNSLVAFFPLSMVTAHLRSSARYVTYCFLAGAFFSAAGFFSAGFFAAVFAAAGFFSAGFLGAAVFAAAVFFSAGFFAAAVLAAGFFSAGFFSVFYAAVFSGFESLGIFFLSAISSPPYLVSLWRVCFLQNLQYLFISSLSGVFFLFFIVL